MSFDKQVFSALLEKAKGKRSINKYALDSSVDAGYISRLMRCLIDSAPSANIIRKLADKAHNDVTDHELMVAAGYLSEEELFIEHSIKGDGVKEQASTFGKDSGMAFYGGGRDWTDEEIEIADALIQKLREQKEAKAKKVQKDK